MRECTRGGGRDRGDGRFQLSALLPARVRPGRRWLPLLSAGLPRMLPLLLTFGLLPALPGRMAVARSTTWSPTVAAPLRAATVFPDAAPATSAGPAAEPSLATAPPPTANRSAEDSLYTAFRPLLAGAFRDRQIDDPADLYKFIHQATMGPGHMAGSVEAARQWIQQEWQELESKLDEPSAAEPMLEPLRPDGQLVRVYLGPLNRLALGSAPQAERASLVSAAQERLAIAFVRTAEAWLPRADELRGLWFRACADSSLWAGRFTAAQLDSFTIAVSSAGWPAVHHSEGYRQRWSPHYRVVAPSLLPPAWRAGSVAGSLPKGQP